LVHRDIGHQKRVQAPSEKDISALKTSERSRSGDNRKLLTLEKQESWLGMRNRDSFRNKAFKNEAFIAKVDN